MGRNKNEKSNVFVILRIHHADVRKSCQHSGGREDQPAESCSVEQVLGGMGTVTVMSHTASPFTRTVRKWKVP